MQPQKQTYYRDPVTGTERAVSPEEIGEINLSVFRKTGKTPEFFTRDVSDVSNKHQFGDHTGLQQ